MARGEAGVSAPTIERRGRRDINVRDRAYQHVFNTVLARVKFL
jgi:hypothetical protein